MEDGFGIERLVLGIRMAVLVELIDRWLCIIPQISLHCLLAWFVSLTEVVEPWT